MRQRFSTETDSRDYFVWNKIERTKHGPQGKGQDVRSNVAVLLVLWRRQIIAPA